MTDDTRTWAADILRGERITDRCLRAWIARGRFPPPDGRLGQRNYWLRSTYERWRADVAAGRYAIEHRPPGQRTHANAA